MSNVSPYVREAAERAQIVHFPSRFPEGMTICDLPDDYEMKPTHWQVKARERRVRRLRIFLNIAALSAALSFIGLCLWAASYPYQEPIRQAMEVTHGWENGR